MDIFWLQSTEINSDLLKPKGDFFVVFFNRVKQFILNNKDLKRLLTDWIHVLFFQNVVDELPESQISILYESLKCLENKYRV